jgi:hypothetical protein
VVDLLYFHNSDPHLFNLHAFRTHLAQISCKIADFVFHSCKISSESLKLYVLSKNGPLSWWIGGRLMR